MDPDFDPEDKYSWYFGPLTRDETNDILLNQSHSGTFLVRESKTMKGDFVLCVREDAKVSHYIVNRIQTQGGATRFKIGDKEFPDIPSLLNFYKTHYLDTTTLIQPAPREKLLCKYDFAGKDPEDLPFKKGETLEVISHDEDEWWTARNAQGRVGQIPVKYTQKLDTTTTASTQSREQPGYQQPQLVHNVQLPAKAVVITKRIPNAYDRKQLALNVGDIVTVLKMNLNGQWEGRLNGRDGIFPFTHVQFLSQEELDGSPT